MRAGWRENGSVWLREVDRPERSCPTPSRTRVEGICYIFFPPLTPGVGLLAKNLRTGKEDNVGHLSPVSDRIVRRLRVSTNVNHKFHKYPLPWQPHVDLRSFVVSFFILFHLMSDFPSRGDPKIDWHRPFPPLFRVCNLSLSPRVLNPITAFYRSSRPIVYISYHYSHFRCPIGGLYASRRPSARPPPRHPPLLVLSFAPGFFAHPSLHAFISVQWGARKSVSTR